MLKILKFDLIQTISSRKYRYSNNQEIGYASQVGIGINSQVLVYLSFEHIILS